MINATPDRMDKIQRIRARLLSLCESITKPSRNLVCALRANANANNPKKILKLRKTKYFN